MTNDELIALARVKATQSGHIESPTWRALTWSLIDGLEAATAERDAALGGRARAWDEGRGLDDRYDHDGNYPHNPYRIPTD